VTLGATLRIFQEPPPKRNPWGLTFSPFLNSPPPRYRNSLKEPAIPSSIIEKPPSSELRPEQKDSDLVPHYGQPGPVLTVYVERDKSIEQTIAMVL